MVDKLGKMDMLMENLEVVRFKLSYAPFSSSFSKKEDGFQEK